MTKVHSMTDSKQQENIEAHLRYLRESTEKGSQLEPIHKAYYPLRDIVATQGQNERVYEAKTESQGTGNACFELVANLTDIDLGNNQIQPDDALYQMTVDTFIRDSQYHDKLVFLNKNIQGNQYLSHWETVEGVFRVYSLLALRGYLQQSLKVQRHTLKSTVSQRESTGAKWTSISLLVPFPDIEHLEISRISTQKSSE